MKKSELIKKPGVKAPTESGTKALNRRAFVRLGTALGDAAIAAPHLNLSSALAQTPSASPSPVPSLSPTPTPLRVTKDMLRQAEKLIGIELTDAQEAIPAVNVVYCHLSTAPIFFR